MLILCVCSGLQAQTGDQNDESAQISNERTLDVSREIGAYQTGIEEIQAKIGIYDQSLIEAYRSLAALYNEIEDYENASALFLNALQVARINTGLYSLEQLPIVRLLIENQVKAKEWRSADDYHELAYLISSRIFTPIDTEYLNSVNSYGAWKMQVIRENLFDQSRQSLLLTAGELSGFYNRVIVKVEQQVGLQAKSLLSVLYTKTKVDMTLARYVASVPYTNFQGTASPFINQTRCRNLPNSRGQVVRQCYAVQIENPRYRQSQKEAKRFAISRHTRAVSKSIGKLENIRNNSAELTNAEKQNIDIQISELVIESQQLLNASERPYLF